MAQKNQFDFLTVARLTSESMPSLRSDIEHITKLATHGDLTARQAMQELGGLVLYNLRDASQQ